MPKFNIQVVETRTFTAELVIEARSRDEASSAVLAGLLAEHISFEEDGVQDSDIHIIPADDEEEPVAKVKADGTVVKPKKKA